MPITSLDFGYFVLASLAVYYLLPGRFQNLFLLLISYYFYFTWNWLYVPVLLGMTIFNFYYAQFLQRTAPDRQKPALRIGVLVNLAVFAVFLFGGSLNLSLAALFKRLGSPGLVINILFPLGFSYYVFECISYLIDVRLKRTPASANFFDFALYLAYFPKLISGPLERGRLFLPQLTEKKSIDNTLLARSLVLIFTGLFRMLVLSGLFIILLPPTVFNEPLEYTSAELLVSIILFSFYLYNQFAGYTNIVRGISALFGIELSPNFRFPFFARNFTEFWNRWHISLSHWLRDYIYFPASRASRRRFPNPANLVNLMLPPLATMLVSGMWHGSSWHLLAWGALHGGYLLIERLPTLWGAALVPVSERPRWRQWLGSGLVFSLATLAWIPFLMDIPTSKRYLYGILQGNTWHLPGLLPFIIMAFSLLLDWVQFRPDDEFIFLKWPPWIQSLLMALVVFAVVIVYNLQTAPDTFIYP